jgi:hypothetical protein
MQTAFELLHSKKGLTIYPRQEAYLLEVLKEYARQACEEQKKLCAIHFLESDGFEVDVVTQAPLPELK